MSKTFNTIDEFRAAAKASEAPIAEAHVRSSFDTAIELAADPASRTVTFTISTASVDRMGDTIAVDGWQMESYRKNPVVLWAHDSSSLPVGKASKLWIESNKLKAETTFTPPGMARFNDTVYEMIKGGFLNATSVGFLPLKYSLVDDPKRRFGIDFIEQELLEFSVVPVPANAEALIEGKSAGIDVEPILNWCEQTLRKAADPSRIVKLAESVLGTSGQDMVAITWAEKIVAGAGKTILTPERATRIAKLESAAAKARLAKNRARDLEVVRLRGS